MFDGLSEGYLKKAGAADIMTGVPVPLRKDDMMGFAGGGFSLIDLAENMVWVMGADTGFKYNRDYALFLKRMFGEKIFDAIIKKGGEAAEKEDLDKACIFFRAALLFYPDDMQGIYGYARVCREMYLKSDDPEYTGRFKAESTTFFEKLAERYPEFAPAYYYLGYAYLNAGLYLKSELAWKEFLKRGGSEKESGEIRERLNQIASPVRIEQGYNMALSGRFRQGIEILEPFLESQFKTWWPLYYYLGLCYKGLGMKEEALDSFKNVLSLNASHIATMEELAGIYEDISDHENAEKYSKKIALIR